MFPFAFIKKVSPFLSALLFNTGQLENDILSICTVNDAETSWFIRRCDADQNVVAHPAQLSGTDVGRKNVFAGTNLEVVVQLEYGFIKD